MTPGGKAPSRRSDRGVVTPIELMYVMIFALIVVAFLGYVGRTIAAGVQTTNAAQDAARAASIALDPDAGEVAARAAIGRSDLPETCSGTASADFSWAAGPDGAWQGGTVTVRITCQVTNASLTGVWTPGVRTLSVTDTQVVDRFRR